MDEDLRQALGPIARALRANTTAVQALREHLIAEAAVDGEQRRRVEEILLRVEDQLEPVIHEVPDSPRVALAREEQTIERLALVTRVYRAPRSAWAWLRADPLRTGLLISTIGGVLVQITSGAPIIATLGRALLSWGTTSAGGAP